MCMHRCCTTTFLGAISISLCLGQVLSPLSACLTGVRVYVSPIHARRFFRAHLSTEATLFTTSSVLTLSAWSNSSYLCQTMRPPSPLPGNLSSDGTYCPIAAGPFAFSATIPWGRNRELTTLLTRLRAVDPFGKSLLCVDVLTTPLAPSPHSPYGRANIIFWATVALAAAYWIVGSFARVASAWNRGITREGGGWARARSAGYVLASAISGERLAAAPALMRFCEILYTLGCFGTLMFGSRYAGSARCHIPHTMVRCACDGCSGMAPVRVYVPRRLFLLRPSSFIHTCFVLL